MEEKTREPLKGIFIESKIAERIDLSWNEKAVYSQITFINKPNGASVRFISNIELSKTLGIDERTVRNVLKNLYEKKLIMYQRNGLHDRQRILLPYNKATIRLAKSGLLDNHPIDYKE